MRVLRMRSLAFFFFGLFGFSAAATASEILLRQQWGAKPPIKRRDPVIKDVNTGSHRVKVENIMSFRKSAVYLAIHHTGRKVPNAPFAKT